VTNAERYHFADFTRTNYRALLRLAKATYTLRGFDDLDRAGAWAIWRHDIDFSPAAALALARIEHEEGVRATYFVLLRSEFYNALDARSVAAIRELVALGHTVGLHLDPSAHAIATADDLDRAVDDEARILASIAGVEITAFSFHNPTEASLRFDGERYAGRVNTYARWLRDDVGYCSDSNGYWRHRRLEDVLRAGADPRLQVLTHPVWWQDEVMSPRQRVWKILDDHTADTKAFYAALLARHGRDNVDWE